MREDILFSIGEFSKAAQLTIKTLRYYHDIGLLEPDMIDKTTGYRYYNDGSFDKVRMINALKDMGFTLNEMLAILSQCKNERDIMYFIKHKLTAVNVELRRLGAYKKRLIHFKELVAGEHRQEPEIKEIFRIQQMMAGIRMRGNYNQIAEGFFRLLTQLGGQVGGKPCCLHYDLEYREDDAHFMPCFEVNAPVNRQGIDFVTIESGDTVSIIHRGPYHTMGKAYGQLFRYIHEKKYAVTTPIMERYLRGPGLVFKGNPANYLTEITFPVSKE